MKTALITGITGQDGSFLAEFPVKTDRSWQSSCWKRVMTCTEPFVARRSIIVSVLPIWRAVRTSTCIMPIWVTR